MGVQVWMKRLCDAPYLQSKSECLILKPCPDEDLVLVGFLGHPDTGGNYAQSIVCSAVDETDLSLYLALSNKDQVWILLWVEGCVVIRDPDSNVGLVDKAD